ncbi:MAG: hypothetical protein TH68_04350 [Candidatus Synechococcus spongiarum 142]|uniref:Glycerol dehydrogenase n=1 Tax=Candidatus Synechococcus spongiarum 142 TaxID=1608213 RepID=A0A6N3X0X2_9SYNE|nr:MAG: hypothetical protein TH68_04350 [Candidatus Synechococcus spongiarum 142]
MDAGKTVVLAPGLGLPLAILLLGSLLCLVNLAVGGAMALLGLILLFQSVRLRLVFAPDALELHNGAAVLRRFPYKNWRSWSLFWKPLPILLYFREVNGIHFVPVIVDGQGLRQQLEQRLGHVNVAANSADAT